MQELIFRTKRDVNGNTYYFIVDIENRTAKSGYNLGFGLYNDGIEVTKKGLRDMQEKFAGAGFVINYI